MALELFRQTSWDQFAAVLDVVPVGEIVLGLGRPTDLGSVVRWAAELGERTGDWRYLERLVHPLAVMPRLLPGKAVLHAAFDDSPRRGVLDSLPKTLRQEIESCLAQRSLSSGRPR